MQDARTVKLVPAETKTITTDDGATHEISRYIVVPDDHASSPDADTVTHEKLRFIISPDGKNNASNDELREYKLLHKNTHERSGGVVNMNTKFIKTDTKTVNAPGLVNFLTFKDAVQGTADTKVTKTVLPSQQYSKTTVYINGHKSDSKSVSVTFKQGFKFTRNKT